MSPVTIARRRIPVTLRATLLAWAVSCAAVASPTTDPIESLQESTPLDNTVLVNGLLNRWEPIAEQAGAHSSPWREMFATQLFAMDVSILRGLERLKADPLGDVRASYARFTQAFRGAQMRSFELSKAGKGPVKFASTTTDQVYIPIVPCRIVDTRNVGGPISAGNTRNFLFYSTGNADDWSGQGGVAGPSGTTCPGTILPNGGFNPPSAAVVTVTVVAPSAAGNWIIWSGTNPKPTISALNWLAGDIKSNTTVIPEGGRSGSGPGGPIQDFAVAYNGPSGSAHVVADVVGYVVENQATGLECLSTLENVEHGSGGLPVRVTAPACPTGYALTGGNCRTGNPLLGAYLVSEYRIGAFPQAAWSCAYANASALAVYAGSICCRVPGL